MKSLNDTLWNDVSLEEMEVRDEYGICFCVSCVTCFCVDCFCFSIIP